ncbi:MAG: hypothetical protein M3X11_19415 [Acidobacteriota bacterium]|nr:hypothetical protein [Acidobacteriota bacterium]
MKKNMKETPATTPEPLYKQLCDKCAEIIENPETPSVVAEDLMKFFSNIEQAVAPVAIERIRAEHVRSVGPLLFNLWHNELVKKEGGIVLPDAA